VEVMEAMAAEKGQPFSVRFTKETDRYVEEEARRTGRSKSAVVEDLANEAATARRFPGVSFQGAWPDREPVVTGTGFAVWQLCDTIDAYGSVEAVVDDFDGVTELHCRLARAYREAYPDEIEDAIAANTRGADEWRALFPFIEWAARAERTS
jgi:uncharacterized protein (DUF433 family)